MKRASHPKVCWEGPSVDQGPEASAGCAFRPAGHIFYLPGWILSSKVIFLDG